MEKKALSAPDEKRSFDKGQVELVALGGVTFGRVTLQPGWKWSTCVKPIAKTKSCEASQLLLIRLFQQAPLGSVAGVPPDVSEKLARVSVAVRH